MADTTYGTWRTPRTVDGGHHVRYMADTAHGTWRPALAGPRRSPLPKVVERTAAVADARRMRDGAGHVLLGARGRIVQLAPERETCRNGGGVRASGTVGVRTVHARYSRLVERLAIEDQIHDLPSGL